MAKFLRKRRRKIKEEKADKIRQETQIKQEKMKMKEKQFQGMVSFGNNVVGFGESFGRELNRSYRHQEHEPNDNQNHNNTSERRHHYAHQNAAKSDDSNSNNNKSGGRHRSAESDNSLVSDFLSSDEEGFVDIQGVSGHGQHGHLADRLTAIESSNGNIEVAFDAYDDDDDDSEDGKVAAKSKVAANSAARVPQGRHFQFPDPDPGIVGSSKQTGTMAVAAAAAARSIKPRQTGQKESRARDLRIDTGTQLRLLNRNEIARDLRIDTGMQLRLLNRNEIADRLGVSLEFVPTRGFHNFGNRRKKGNTRRNHPVSPMSAISALSSPLQAARRGHTPLSQKTTTTTSSMDNTNWSGKGQGLDLPLTLSTGQVNINLDSPVETSVLACKNCNELIVFHVPGLMKKFKKQLKKNQLVGLGVTMGYLNIHDFDADQLVYHCLKYLVKQRNPLVHSLHSKVLDDEQLHTSIIYYVYNKLAPEYDVVPISISEVVVKRDEEIEAKNAEIAELRSTVAAQNEYIATQDEYIEMLEKDCGIDVEDDDDDDEQPKRKRGRS